jgi:hypothetical protein
MDILRQQDISYISLIHYRAPLFHDQSIQHFIFRFYTIFYLKIKNKMHELK